MFKIFGMQFGKEEEKKQEPQRGSVLASYESAIYEGQSFSLYNPDELLIKKGNQVYENMVNDDQVKAVLSFKMASVVSRGWSFDVQVDNEEHQKIADFFWAVINNMHGSFTDKLKAVLSAYKNGFFIGEKIWDNMQFDGKTYWTVADIRKKPFSTFLFKVNEYGDVLELVQEVDGKEIKVPMDKVIHHVYQPDEDVLYGRSDLRACYRAFWSKDTVIKFQNIHLERHASGLPVVTAGEGADISQKSAILKMLKNLTVKSGFYMPKGFTLDVHGPQATDAYEKAVAQHDKSIAKAVLVPNLLGLSEQGNVGSYSQSQTQFDAFIWVIDADTDGLCETLNEQLWKPLAELNFGTDDFPPMIMGELTSEQKKNLAKLWSELVKGNAVVNRPEDEQYTRELLGYPDMSEEDLNPEEEEEPDLTPDELDPEMLPDDLDPDEPIFSSFAERSWLRRVNFKAIDNSFNRVEKIFQVDLNNVLGLVKLSIEKQIIKVAGERSFGNIQLKEFQDIKINTSHLSQISKIIRENLQSIFNENYNIARKNLPKKSFRQTVGMDRTRADKFLSAKSLQIKDILNNDILKAVQNILVNGIKYDKSLGDVMNELDTDTKLREVLPEVDAGGRVINVAARIENIVRTNTAEAVNQARMSLFGSPNLKGFIQAYEYSAILDSRTTEICATLNGKIKRVWNEYLPPNHYQCRSILVPVTEFDDWSGDDDSIPASTRPHQGFA